MTARAARLVGVAVVLGVVVGLVVAVLVTPAIHTGFEWLDTLIASLLAD